MSVDVATQLRTLFGSTQLAQLDAVRTALLDNPKALDKSAHTKEKSSA